MKGIPQYSEAKATTFEGKFPELPKGAYELRISNVREDDYEWGTAIVLMIDIASGEHAGYYTKRYNHDKQAGFQDVKYKGTYRLIVPTDNKNADKFQKQLGFFKSQIEAIEKSNNIKIDCSTDWDINILKNKIVGGLFNLKEWDYKGQKGWFTQCARLVDKAELQDYIDKKKPLPADRPLPEKSTSTSALDSLGFEEAVSDGEVPF